MRAILNQQQPSRFYCEDVITLEVEADDDGNLLEAITDLDLHRELSSLVNGCVQRVNWKLCTEVTEVGLYRCYVLQRDYENKASEMCLKVWVVPLPTTTNNGNE